MKTPNQIIGVSASEVAPAIERLEFRLHEAEFQAAALRTAINLLCVEAGEPPRYEELKGCL